MPSARDNAALIVLLRRGRRSAQVYADLVEEAGSALAVLEQEEAQRELLEPDIASTLELASGEIAAWEEDGMHLLSVLDPAYPENLRAVYDRPPLIFVAGTLEPADARSVAVIGSRAASARGIETATEVSTHLAVAGYTVISGLAAGIDAAAHLAALQSQRRTVAVIGTGLRHSYPPQNAALQRRIASDGAVVSQFWPEAPPSRRSFPMRNAVMSGMALGTVIVEATHASGSRIQARLALAQGRRVFLLEPLLSQQWARELATRPGTHVVRESQEISATIARVTAADSLVG